MNRVGEGQKNVPKLRFKGYEDAWEQRKLESEIKDFIVPMRDKPKEFGGDIPWTRIEDIEGKYLNDTLSNQYVTEETVQLMNLNIIPKDSLIVSSSATFGVVAIVTRDLVTNQTFIGLVPNDKNTLEFWYSFFHSDEARKYMSLESVGSTIFYIAREKFEKMPVKVPKIKEMMVIGEHFNKLDQLITLHQRKYDALKSMKKTLLSKMFPKNGEDVPEIRFKEFTDAWEQRKLGEIVLSEIKGSAKAEMIGGDTPYLETNYLNGGECLFVDSENNVDTDDVIVLWDGSQAGTVYHGFSGALGSTFKAYKTKCLGLFIFQQLKKNQQTIYDKYRTPNIPHVIKTFKDEYDVMLTSEEEQNEIGRYFQQIDHLITLHQRKLEELKKMKKTLLQQMFV